MLVEERFKSVALKIRKENTKLRDVNVATTRALEQETKRARREEEDKHTRVFILVRQQPVPTSSPQVTCDP